MKKKVLIVGGGVGGLICGIYCQKNGFETTILEKTNNAGGNLTGWYRNNCYIDNCIHWLNGSSKESLLHNIWKEVGAFTDGDEFYQSDYFFVSEHNGKKFGLNKEIEITEKEMRENCPEDEKQIEKFLRAVRLCKKILSTEKKFVALSSLLSLLCIYGRKSLRDVKEQCKSPLLKCFFGDYMLPDYSVYILTFTYAMFLLKDASVPKMGSLKMASNICEKYKSLSGTILFNKEVEKLDFDGSVIKSVKTKKGEEYSADYFVFACDPCITFGKLLGEYYMPKKLKKTLANRKCFPLISSFHIAYDVNLEKVDIPDNIIFDCDPIKIGVSTYSRLTLRNYSYGKNYAPKGHFVMQIFLQQRESDYDYFNSLSKQEYEKEKSRISEQVTKEIVKHFKIFENKISILDCWTPLTYTHYFNSYKGSYLCFGLTKKFSIKSISPKIPFCKNAYLSTMWQRQFGGLPVALQCGIECAKAIKKSKDVI